MRTGSFLIGIAVFITALLLGGLSSVIVRYNAVPDSDSVSVKEIPRNESPDTLGGAGKSGPSDRGLEPGEKIASETLCSGTCGLKIISKERAEYTEQARQNNTEGSLVLRVTFLASGKIGSVSPISTLPDGLTEHAIIAARKIRFNPATKNGVPYTVTKPVQYSFSIF